MMYVYIQSERPLEDTFGLWTVGFYDPQGFFQPESDHTSPNAAAQRVHFLNGGALDNYGGQISVEVIQP